MGKNERRGKSADLDAPFTAEERTGAGGRRPYEELANAIVLSAAQDYWLSWGILRMYSDAPVYEKALREHEERAVKERRLQRRYGYLPRKFVLTKAAIIGGKRREAERTLAECEKFFASPEMDIYCHGADADAVVRTIKRQRGRRLEQKVSGGAYRERQSLKERIRNNIEIAHRASKRGVAAHNKKIAAHNERQTQLIKLIGLCRYLVNN